MDEKLNVIIGTMILACIVIGIICKLILKIYKLEDSKDKWNKYDNVAAMMVDLVLCSMYISLFGGMVLQDRSALDANTLTTWMAMCTAIPYSVYITLVCGYKRLKIVGMTLLNITICYGGFILIVWVA